MFREDLVIISKSWKPPNYPSIGEWVSKLWYVQTMEYYSVIKKDKLSNHVKTWMNFKCLLLNERSRSKKPTYYMTSFTWLTKKAWDSSHWKGLLARLLFGLCLRTWISEGVPTLPRIHKSGSLCLNFLWKLYDVSWTPFLPRAWDFGICYTKCTYMTNLW